MPEPFCCAFSIRSDTRYLEVMRRLIDALRELAGHERFSQKVSIACKMALVEAIDNAIVHAHRRKKHLPLKVLVSVDASEIRMCVTDCGRGPDGVPSRRPDALSSHGRGLFLIQNAMTEVQSSLDDQTHTLTMVLKL